MVLSEAAGPIASGNLSAFDVIGGKHAKLQATRLFPLKMRTVAQGNTEILSLKVHHQNSVMSYATDNRKTRP